MNRLLLLSVAFSSFIFSAQAQVGFGIEAGFNVSDYTLKTNNNIKPTDPKLGGRLGVISDIGITDNFYFQPGLHYVTNGYKAFITNGYEQYILNSTSSGLWAITGYMWVLVPISPGTKTAITVYS